MSKIARRKLGMHEKLLFDTIQRQAGTLEKANVEGVMNSIEAGCSAVHITLNDNVDGNAKAVMNIHDDGRGIQSEKEVQEFFETFGTPHTESECTTWKQFRMGRGQMFAYGKNIWRTATFRMTVDIKNWGLEYEFEAGLPYVEGCDITIELYKNPIGCYPYYSMNTYKEAIQTQVRFVEAPVFFNEEQINTTPSDCTWDMSDDKAYYLFNVGTALLVYNLGVFVQDIHASISGMGGVIVSKEQLKVNFARNDVISDCEVMSHINEVVRDNRIKKTRQSRRVLNIWERQATLTDLRDGTQQYNDIKTLSLIPTAQGKHVSLDFIRKNKQQWCFAEEGNTYADRLMEREQAVCIDVGVISNLNYTGHPSLFFSWLTSNENAYVYGNKDWDAVEKLYIDYSALSSGVSEDYSMFPNKKMTVSERRIIKVLNSYNCWNGRVINLGFSERANAWTDGSTYITIERSYLKKLSMTSPTCINKLMMLLTHEMAHDNDTRGTHIHGPYFYENMVRILESYDAPTIYNAVFIDSMRSSKINERQCKELEKEKRAEEETQKKLGLNVAASKSL